MNKKYIIIIKSIPSILIGILVFSLYSYSLKQLNILNILLQKSIESGMSNEFKLILIMVTLYLTLNVFVTFCNIILKTSNEIEKKFIKK